MFNWLDYTCFTLIGISIVIGCMRGFVKEVISLCTWIAAGLAAVYLTKDVQLYFKQWIQSDTTREVCAFILIVIAVLLLGFVLAKLLSSCLRLAGLGLIDRFLGMLFGAMRAGVLLVLLFSLLTAMHFQQTESVQGSTVAKHIAPLSSWISKKMPGGVKAITAWSQEIPSTLRNINPGVGLVQR